APRGRICQPESGHTKPEITEGGEPMQAFLKKNRWSILAAGAAIQILTGVPAAWGVFQGPGRAEYGFDEGAASFVLSLTIGAFGLGCVIGGFLQDKAGPRIAGFAGTALLAAGFF